MEWAIVVMHTSTADKASKLSKHGQIERHGVDACGGHRRICNHNITFAATQGRFTLRWRRPPVAQECLAGYMRQMVDVPEKN
jgi:hypothetical protein